jgi:hypothetical protein
MIMETGVVYASDSIQTDFQLYSMIRDPNVNAELEGAVAEEVLTGQAAEQGQNGGLLADK